MKGIILAGGSGTRLYPMTIPCVKQLLPIYDKPMVYYPLATLMQAGIREILLISTPEDLPRFEELFGDGSDLGLEISYKAQSKPRGIAEALILGADFIGGERVALILGDNLFHSFDLESLLLDATETSGASVFGCEVSDPSRYGVVDFNEEMQVTEIVEKPEHAPSPYAVTGLYFYDHTAPEKAASLKPSLRGELEITDLNNLYIKENNLTLHLLPRGFAWLDTGTTQALHQASSYVQTLQERCGIMIGCIEEIAYLKNYITLEQLQKLTEPLLKTPYGEYLSNRYNAHHQLALDLFT
ncbi:MAG: Glucose-1-phosphate thymidylyltransferase 1 [Chlamydiia bacterium]|nr:Glucose-1-phosphate thymidylyltransferase 1 [Chlamydiia bacterium]MCH9615179.1 Glucose-1-phosphate thymidylyltransferase 1 [Chlamydiia bacterium]MCH9628499.1 Glucose-1-phosphate thymidylyltransferase 1 [Chlamydiia bacterium]